LLAGLLILAVAFAANSRHVEPNVLVRHEHADIGLQPLHQALDDATAHAGFIAWKPAKLLPGMRWDYVDASATDADSSISASVVLGFVTKNGRPGDTAELRQGAFSGFPVQHTIELTTGVNALHVWQIPGPTRSPDGRIISQYIARRDQFQFVASFYGSDQPAAADVLRLLRSLQPVR
jgi:hypothetical protein